MSKWIDFSLEERKAMIQGVVEARKLMKLQQRRSGG